jgi:hypothetical protein
MRNHAAELRTHTLGNDAVVGLIARDEAPHLSARAAKAVHEVVLGGADGITGNIPGMNDLVPHHVAPPASSLTVE